MTRLVLLSWVAVVILRKDPRKSSRNSSRSKSISHSLTIQLDVWCGETSWRRTVQRFVQTSRWVLWLTYLTASQLEASSRRVTKFSLSIVYCIKISDHWHCLNSLVHSLSAKTLPKNSMKRSKISLTSSLVIKSAVMHSMQNLQVMMEVEVTRRKRRRKASEMKSSLYNLTIMHYRNIAFT